ncbi:hypothetical protein HK096_004231 [Nowakowskiella sp. JEL0078]|nr:hypothetical protein HK096_004231 [Nowakowskiella sp. JEL0078]
MKQLFSLGQRRLLASRIPTALPIRFYSSDGLDGYFKYLCLVFFNLIERPKYDTSHEVEADVVHPSAQELWTQNQGIKPPKQYPNSEPDRIFKHPLYDPPTKADTSVPLVSPLVWPVNDMPQSDTPGWKAAPLWHEIEWEDPSETPIGDYPRNVPFLWTSLREPKNHWDKQGRREYGEVLNDYANYGDWLSIGHDYHWSVPLQSVLTSFGLIALIGVSVALWDPSKHKFFAEKDYPFDGLRVELGGDPEDAEDKWMAAHVYKD